MTHLYVELARILLATAFLAAVMVGIGAASMVLVGRDRLRALPFLTLSVATGWLAIHLVELARYALGLPGWVGSLALGSLAFAGIFGTRERLLAVWRQSDVRDAIAAVAGVAIGLVGLVSVIHTFGGGDWQMDWIGHYDRAMHWLALSPDDPFGYGDTIPSRPPLGNHLASAFLSVSGPSLAAYQIVMAISAALVVLPLGWALREMGASARAATCVGALLLIDPFFVQNATYPWTKMSAAFFAVAGLVVAQRTLRGRLQRTGAPLAVALLGGAALAHYSTIPFLLVVGGALVWHEARGDRPRNLAWMGGALLLVVGPWLLTSSLLFGVRTTFAPFTSTEPSVARLFRAGGDVIATLVPHPLRGVSLEPIAQVSSWGMLRDQIFFLYQTCAPLSGGLVGLVAAIATLSRPSCRRPALAWMGLGLCVIMGVAWVHPWPAPFGLAHIGWTPLALLAIPLIASVWKRGGAWPWVLAGLGAIDLAFGIVLHLGLESASIELDGTGLGAALGEAVRDNRRLAVDAGVQTLGERLGAMRGWGFVVYGVALAWMVRRALPFFTALPSSSALAREPSVSKGSARGEDALEPRWLRVTLVAAALAIPVAVYAWFSPTTSLQLDETVHFPQVELFLDHGLRTHPRLTMIPGLHLLVAVIEAAFGVRELWVARLAGLLGGVGLVSGAWWWARRLTPARVGWRSLQVAALPLVAPLYAVFYTDVVGVALLVAAAAALMMRRIGVAALLLFLMLAVRHSLVGFAAWLSLLSAFACWKETEMAEGADTRARVLRVARSHAVLLVPLGGFAVAAWLMGGPSVGDTGFHPLSIHLANVPFSITIAGVLFAPSHLRAAPRVWALARARPWPTALCIVGFALAAALSTADHPFNVATIDGTLPNRWIDALFRTSSGRMAMIALSAYVPLSLATWRWRVPGFATIFLLWFARMGASWLVEPRYTMPFVVFVLLAREEEPRWVEVAYVPAYAATTLYFVDGMIQNEWFPL